MKSTLQAKKALGRPKRPSKSKLDSIRVEIEALLQNSSKQNFIANRYGITEATLLKRIKRIKFKSLF